MDIELAQTLAENKLLKSLLYCTKRSCNNCGKVNCENFQRQRVDCCGNWVSYKDYIKQLEEEKDKRIADLEKENAELKSENQKWKDEWQEQVQKATDEGYERTLQTIQLTKAKHYIKELARAVEHSYSVLSWQRPPIKAEAEQFLNSEVEK